MQSPIVIVRWFPQNLLSLLEFIPDCPPEACSCVPFPKDHTEYLDLLELPEFKKLMDKNLDTSIGDLIEQDRKFMSMLRSCKNNPEAALSPK